MRMPSIRGIIDRRMLINYRIDPDIVARILPEPFEPKIVSDHAIAGICLIRLRNLRPTFFPATVGLTSENAAHRFAVEWRDPVTRRRRSGVYIVRRDTSSCINTLLGGRLFSGEQHHARFNVREHEDAFFLDMTSDDRRVRVHLSAERGHKFPPFSAFQSIDDASAFFEAGSLGYAATTTGDRFDGVELCCETWNVQALEVHSIESSYFDDPGRFPPGSIKFDCALLMRGIDHEWHEHEPLVCGSGEPAASVIG